MGDRTRVTLTVAKEHRDIVAEFDEPQDEWESCELVDMVYDEVNWARLTFETEMLEQGIAYDKQWEAGGEYGAGTEYLRFTDDGLANLITAYDTDLGLDTLAILTILDLPGLTDAQRLAQIRYETVKHAQNTIPLPWTNQLANGKRYRTRQLVKPNKEPSWSHQSLPAP